MIERGLVTFEILHSQSVVDGDSLVVVAVAVVVVAVAVVVVVVVVAVVAARGNDGHDSC